MEDITVKELELTACKIRYELLKMFSFGKAHHFGGSFSCVDLLTSIYFHRMRYDKNSMDNPVRDRFIMSKGHSVPAQYVVLAMVGILNKEELKTIKTLGSRLQGHPDMTKTPGIEAPTGSLGMGLSFANGIALAGKLDKRRFNIYVMLGDGELHEGQVWEAAMTTASYGIGNVCVIIDRNQFQSQGRVDEIKRIEPVRQKWEAMGWRAIEIDGHSIAEITKALDLLDDQTDVPLAIIANTIKGKGISFLENTYKYHNYSLTEEEFNTAVCEIENLMKTITQKG